MNKITYILFALPFLAFATDEGTSRVVEKGSTWIHVIEFASNANEGFVFIDAPKPKNYIDQHYSKKEHLFMVNGAYFDHNLNPVGYCRIDGKDLSTTISKKLSGFVTTTKEGKLELHWKSLPEGKAYNSIIQSGPYIIDPGGKIGIHGKTGKTAKRTAIGFTNDQKVLILTTSEVTLYDLARILKAEIPNVERILNLDGGPSTALAYNQLQIKNTNPVRNFLTKKK